MGYDCTKVREEQPKSSGYFWLIILGSLLSSATWGGVLYGPTAVNNVAQWWNSPPVMSEIGEKINVMLDDQSSWTINDTREDEIVYTVNGVKKVGSYCRSDYKSYFYIYDAKMQKRTDPKHEVSDHLSEKENKYLTTKAKEILSKLKATRKQERANELLEKIN